MTRCHRQLPLLTSGITLVWGLVTRFLPTSRPRVAHTSLKLRLLSVTGWWAHPLRRGTNRGTNTQSILGNPGLPERTPWTSVQVGRSWRGSGLLVNGRSAVRIRSPAPRSASLARTPIRADMAPVQPRVQPTTGSITRRLPLLRRRSRRARSPGARACRCSWSARSGYARGSSSPSEVMLRPPA
jgi:hypothetical protein